MPRNPKWIEELSNKDKESAKRLNNILLSIQRHKGIYSLSGDPAVAQLWFGLLELSRRQENFDKVVSDLKYGKTPKVSDVKEKKRSEILEALENY